MRPPSYYASLTNYNYGSSSSSNLNYTTNNNNYNTSSAAAITTTSNHLNRSSSSHQLRSSFSSPSSSSYVTRSHLPFVSQSMLVAHCFTGVSSSTKPNYGHQHQQRQPSYSSSSYSTSYSRPKSTKRYQTTSSSIGSSGSGSSSYLSSNNYTPSSVRTSSSSYLSSGHNSLSSSSYKRSPPTSSSSSSYYYPKPIRLRERPLLTQISRQLNTTTRPSTTTYKSSYPLVHSHERKTFESPSSRVESIKRDSNLKSGELSSTLPDLDPKQKEEEEEKNWSSDVARNISRNKYLIKFREFEKRPSIVGAPIQLTNNCVEPSTELAENSVNKTDDLLVAPEVVSQVVEPSIVEEEEPSISQLKIPQLSPVETQLEQNKDTSETPMKVPVISRESRRPSADQTLDSELPLKKFSGKVELASTNEIPDIETKSSSIKRVDEEVKQTSKAPKEKRNIKLKIRTTTQQKSDSTEQVPEAEPNSKVLENGQHVTCKKDEKIPNTNKPTADEANNSISDSPKVANKPKVKRLVKTSSKAALKKGESSPASPEEVKSELAKPVKQKSPEKPRSPPEDGSENKSAKQVTESKIEFRQKSAIGEDKQETSRKVLGQKQQKQSSEELPVVKHQKKEQVETATTTIQKDDIEKRLIMKGDEEENNGSDIAKEMVQQNKRIRFRDYHLDDFNFLSVLGHGGWGFVILAELKEHDACFAVKCIKKITIVEDDDFDSIMIERKVLTLGNVHPFICKLFCTFETEGYLFFVMEYCAGGDLMFHVQKEGKFTEARCRFYAAEIICAIRFLHNRHIIYRDLKLDNILLDSRGHVRLVDFGMCQCRTYREEMLPSNFCGTPEYISPEIIKGVPYNHSVDWWSFGVLLYEMAVGKMPFRGNDENELLWNVCYEQIHYPMFLTKELTCLLQSLLEREPTKRMGMATCKAGDIYDQAWFRGVDWAAIEEMRVPPPFIPEVNSKRDVQNFDADFTESRAELSPVDDSTLQKIDQTQFQRFPYTNPDIFIFESLC